MIRRCPKNHQTGQPTLFNLALCKKKCRLCEPWKILLSITQFYVGNKISELVVTKMLGILFVVDYLWVGEYWLDIF